MKKSVLTIAITVLALPAFADAPVLQNSGPIIYLADNLDEPDGLGYCIDTKDRGQTERVQVHSCKPDADNPQDRDVLFELNAETGRIEHAEYTGFCLTVNQGDAETELGLLECVDGDASQQFVYDADSGALHVAGDADVCLVAAAESTQAGPFMSRTLGLLPCADADASLRTWEILTD